MVSYLVAFCKFNQLTVDVYLKRSQTKKIDQLENREDIFARLMYAEMRVV